MHNSANKRLLIVQYAGDYRKTFEQVREKGIETYHAQKYVIDSISDISQEIEEAILLCCKTEEKYNTLLQPRMRAVGTATDPFQQHKQICQIITELNPTHLVVHSPIPTIFSWAIRKRVKTIALLADSFLQRGLRNRIKNSLLAAKLNNRHVEWVANHGVNSCLSLQNIGVNPNKIIPWDWPHFNTPDELAPKTLRSTDVRNLVYVGAVAPSKGVGEILEALAILRDKNITAKLNVAGKGDIDYFINKSKQLNIQNNINFLGLVPHNQIIDLMRQADLVIVPSWHQYPEGLPLTIYEALCARTPIIASDHPMFNRNLQDGISAIIFPERNSMALANSILKLLSNPELYHNLSCASLNAWKQLQLPVKWGKLIYTWLNNSQDDKNWLSDHSLNSDKYKY
jgi:glycosyltransferase involved in cell wall biosynthesis